MAAPVTCDPLNPPSLQITIGTSADGESGSWGSLACDGDADYIFNAFVACCNSPLLVPTDETCLVPGQIISTINGAGITAAGDDYEFLYYNSNGDLVFTEIITVGSDDDDVVSFEDVRETELC